MDKPPLTFAVVLMKCRPGDEDAIRKSIRAQRELGPHICLHGSARIPHEKACRHVNVIEMAYCFGPFDFLFVVTSTEVRNIERFVVECVRGNAKRIQDTQTILGITLQ